MLNHDDFEQHDWVYARSAIVLAVQFFHEIVDMNKIYRSVDLPEKMVFRYKILHAQNFHYSTPKLLLLIQHLCSLLSLFSSILPFICEKAQLSLAFFDRLNAPFGASWERRI